MLTQGCGSGCFVKRFCYHFHPIASASTASASNRTWTLTESWLYLIYKLADKHDYQNQQLTIYKGTLLVIA